MINQFLYGRSIQNCSKTYFIWIFNHLLTLGFLVLKICGKNILTVTENLILGDNENSQSHIIQ